MLMVLIFVICLAFKAGAYQISGRGSSTAEYDGDAHFNCVVSPPTGVLQVTWQRPSKDEKLDNLATFSKHFGEQVNEPYKGKVNFTERSLNSSSIILRNVTWEDEGCYICAFNVYPDGSKRKQMCLTVQGISKVNTSRVPSTKLESEARREVFSCSATGKPAPSVEWVISVGAIENKTQTSTVTNSDNTITYSSSITVDIPADWTGQVDCVLNKGKMGQRTETLFVSVDKNKNKEKGKDQIAAVIVVLMLILCIIVIAVVVRRRLKRKQRSEFIP
ncbi:OX-2 membrane glycoprotein [Kryptolebias marmoratus]|uniref:OX-2 membrane glycoprotein-like n=1 Tax=Kryptolebias marmoratus TaxID=37003 RepID=A0A3Q2ZMA3_KRYMA|nr:OX-2 membrane glycoprotein [Kryptolebias marmoratus]